MSKEEVRQQKKEYHYNFYSKWNEKKVFRWSQVFRAIGILMIIFGTSPLKYGLILVGLIVTVLSFLFEEKK